MTASFIKIVVVFSLISSFTIYGLADESSTDSAEQSTKKLAIANNDLAFKLNQLLAAESSKNVFFSPFSLSSALGMLFTGTGGGTTKELRQVLGYKKADLSNDQVPIAFSNYFSSIMPENNTKTPDYILELYNALFLKKGMEFYPSYVKEVQKDFMANVKEVDFSRNSAQITNEVNDLVKEKTHGKIDKILDSLDPSTVLLILNAIYFKGNWQTKFPQNQTKPQTFYNHGSLSETKEVPFMHLKSKFPYTHYNDVQAIELPYKGDKISMVILLPDEKDGLPNLEKSLTQEMFLDIRKQLFRQTVTLSLPKFKIEYSRQLNSEFKALGAKTIFTDSANFSRMTPSKGVSVSEIQHKAFIEVNEEGSEAAAVTSIGLRPLAIARPIEINFKADHPFLFAIVDKTNDLVLFLGSAQQF